MFKLSFLQQIIGSIAKIEFYAVFIQQQVKKIMLYVLLLTFIVSMVSGIQLALGWNKQIQEISEEFIRKMPGFVVENGELKVEGTMPQIISQNAEELVIIDTSGNTDETVLEAYPRGVLINRTTIFTKNDVMETKVYDLEAFKSLIITKADVVQYIENLRWLNVAMVSLLFLYKIIENFASALLLAMCGRIAGRLMKFRVDFATLYKISMYALTLPLLLEMAVELLALYVVAASPLGSGTWAGLVKGLLELGTASLRPLFYAVGIFYMVQVLMFLKKVSIEIAVAKNSGDAAE